MICVNGQDREVPPGTTVAQMVSALQLPDGGRGVAVAVDAEVVPRARWSDHRLADGARVEVVTAMQGG